MVFGLLREIFHFDFLITLCHVAWYILLSLFPCLSNKKKLSLRGKRILVTGGSRGVGEELLSQFAKHEPVQVIVISRSAAVLQSICRRLNNDFDTTEFIYYACDLGNKAQVMQLTQTIKSKHGFPHVIVCNAGIVTSGKTVEEISDKEIEYTFNVNTQSHFIIIREFLKAMVESGEDCQIVQVLSLLSFFALPRLGPYCASKAASFILSDSLHSEIATFTDKVRMTTIHPYLIDTAMFSSAKVKFPILMSPLKSTYVAKEIVKATINRDMCVIIPKYMTVLPIIKAFVPVRVWLSIMSVGDPYTFAETLPDKL